MKKVATILLAGASLALVSSCNTFIGLGKDVQSLGKGMENKGHGQTWNGDQPAAQ